MKALTSSPNRDGHLVLVRLPPEACLVLRHVDGSRQDLTFWAADLLLIGMMDAAEERRGEQLTPEDTVEVAWVALEAGADVTPASFTYLHLPSGDWVDLALADALPLVGRGVRVQVTAGAAHEVAAREGLPNDIAGAETPGPLEP